MKISSSKVAVIMSVYYSESIDNLKESVKSIINQTYKNITFFIYQDGVLTEEVSNYLSELESERIILFKSKMNLGLAHALNYMIDYILADGSYDYIARMDSDDISNGSRISTQIEYMDKNIDVDLSGTACREFGSSFSLEEKILPLSHSELIDFCIVRCPFVHPTVIFRTSVFKSGIRYPTNVGMLEDLSLWFVLLDAGYKFSNLPDILLDFRINENTLDRRNGIIKAKNEFFLRTKYMIRLKRINLYNAALVSSRLFFHILPTRLIKVLYKHAR
ncbi:glycosyltransferase [Pectobacterium polonicum]|uniref:glycosyltransferase n=1 Tax=Pectobacterium polonicum TaxID=2485124 RepID=UPI002B24B063|nr:glycosyltransferase [Pectobacterium polonicum]